MDKLDVLSRFAVAAIDVVIRALIINWFMDSVALIVGRVEHSQMRTADR